MSHLAPTARVAGAARVFSISTELTAGDNVPLDVWVRILSQYLSPTECAVALLACKRFARLPSHYPKEFAQLRTSSFNHTIRLMEDAIGVGTKLSQTAVLALVNPQTYLRLPGTFLPLPPSTTATSPTSAAPAASLLTTTATATAITAASSTSSVLPSNSHSSSLSSPQPSTVETWKSSLLRRLFPSIDFVNLYTSLISRSYTLSHMLIPSDSESSRDDDDGGDGDDHHYQQWQQLLQQQYCSLCHQYLVAALIAFAKCGSLSWAGIEPATLQAIAQGISGYGDCGPMLQRVEADGDSMPIASEGDRTHALVSRQAASSTFAAISIDMDLSNFDTAGANLLSVCKVLRHIPLGHLRLLLGPTAPLNDIIGLLFSGDVMYTFSSSSSSLSRISLSPSSTALSSSIAVDHAAVPPPPALTSSLLHLSLTTSSEASLRRFVKAAAASCPNLQQLTVRLHTNAAAEREVFPSSMGRRREGGAVREQGERGREGEAAGPRRAGEEEYVALTNAFMRWVGESKEGVNASHLSNINRNSTSPSEMSHSGSSGSSSSSSSSSISNSDSRMSAPSHLRLVARSVNDVKRLIGLVMWSAHALHSLELVLDFAGAELAPSVAASCLAQQRQQQQQLKQQQRQRQQQQEQGRRQRIGSESTSLSSRVGSASLPLPLLEDVCPCGSIAYGAITYVMMALSHAAALTSASLADYASDYCFPTSDSSPPLQQQQQHEEEQRHKPEGEEDNASSLLSSSFSPSSSTTYPSSSSSSSSSSTWMMASSMSTSSASASLQLQRLVIVLPPTTPAAANDDISNGDVADDNDLTEGHNAIGGVTSSHVTSTTVLQCAVPAVTAYRHHFPNLNHIIIKSTG